MAEVSELGLVGVLGESVEVVLAMDGDAGEEEELVWEVLALYLV